MRDFRLPDNKSDNVAVGPETQGNMLARPIPMTDDQVKVIEEIRRGPSHPVHEAPEIQAIPSPGGGKSRGYGQGRS